MAARIAEDSLSGIASKYVLLEPGPPEAPPIAPGVVDTPIPDLVTRPLGLAGSLQLEYLKWNKSTTVKGKKVNILTSVGCRKGKRPYSTTLKANLPTTRAIETKTVSGSAACK